MHENCDSNNAENKITVVPNCRNSNFISSTLNRSHFYRDAINKCEINLKIISLVKNRKIFVCSGFDIDRKL